MNKNSGFTLVELLAVITVLGLLLTIAIPRIGNIIDDSKRNSFFKEPQETTQRKLCTTFSNAYKLEMLTPGPP